MNKDGSGVINKIFERKNHISRKAPKVKAAGLRGERLEQVIASNIDSIVIITSCQQPKFNNRLLDRLIVAAESSHVEILIVINKIDLDLDEEYKKWLAIYSGLGYKVFATCVKQNLGIDDLKQFLKGKVNLFWGQSGVGKSSLLNKMFPKLSLKIGEISESTSKGKHTTVTSKLIKAENDTFLIDTPGMREIDPYGIREEDLGHYFRDFIPFINECKFNTCTHHHEPGCAILNAVEKGMITKERYKSYLNLRDSIEDDMNF